MGLFGFHNKEMLWEMSHFQIDTSSMNVGIFETLS